MSNQQRQELTEDQKYIIVENLHNSVLAWKELLTEADVTEKHPLKTIQEILNIISPNWETANSCAEVKTRKIIVEAVIVE